MRLSKVTIDEIKQKSGLDFEMVKDYATFGEMIYETTGRRLGVTTLKRLFGNIEDERKPILYTLNTLAMYLGFNSWEEYNSKHSFDSDYDYSDDTVYLSQLMPDTLIEVAYLNRVVTFRVILHDGIKALKVESSANSSLQVGDIVVLYSLKEGTCIEATQVIRGKSLGNYKTHGEITSIKIEEP
jgi:hypothetical protein